MFNVSPSGVNVTSRDQDAVRVDSQGVDNGVVTRQVLDEVPVWEHPLFDVISRTRSKCVSVKQEIKLSSNGFCKGNELSPDG